VRVELAQHGLDVVANRVHAQVELIRNDLVRPATRHAGEDFALSRGEVPTDGLIPPPSMSGITVTNNRFDGSLASACQILDSPTVSLVQSGNLIDATNATAKFLNTASTS